MQAQLFERGFHQRPNFRHRFINILVLATGPHEPTKSDAQDKRNCNPRGFLLPKRVYNLIRAYCVREGISRELDILPARLMEDPLPDGAAEGMTVDAADLEKMKDAYYGYRGWDKTTGKPTPEKLAELGLDELVADLWG